MELEVRAPDEHIGDVLGDLLARRARVAGMNARPGVQVVNAAVPLAEMVGYATALRSSSRGRATYSMQFKEYGEVPHATRERLVARRA
jgi:elongation factor G